MILLYIDIPNYENDYQQWTHIPVVMVNNMEDAEAFAKSQVPKPQGAEGSAFAKREFTMELDEEEQVFEVRQSGFRDESNYVIEELCLHYVEIELGKPITIGETNWFKTYRAKYG